MPDPAARKKTILLVDDEAQILKLVGNLLKDAGYRVLTAANGVEALGRYLLACHNEPIDLIVLDVTMPEIDGLQVLDTIRKEEAGRGISCGDGIPIIMLTGYKSTCMSSFKLGCDDYLLKPTSPEALLEKIHSKIK